MLGNYVLLALFNIQNSTIMFYFVQALGARLEEMMQEDKQHIPNIVTMLSDESKQKQLLLEDEEENFLDECKTA